MLKTITLLSITAALALATPAAFAQNRTGRAAAPPAGPAAQPAKKKQTAGPFHGRLKAVDQASRTLTMGTRTFHVTADTKITKDGKPATLKDAVVGEMVSGYFKTAENGNLVLSTLRFGPKPANEGTAKKKP